MVKVPKEIPWDIIIPEVVKAFTPFIQGISWLALSKVDRRVESLNSLIAIAEIVPAIDLGLPKGVVLAAMYDKTDEALDMINQLAQAIGDLPGDLKKFIQEQVDSAKEEIADIIPDVEIAERQPGESWLDFVERRVRETGFTLGGGLACQTHSSF